MTLTVRNATIDDLPAIVALLNDDILGRSRDNIADLSPYKTAFAAIDADPAQHLVVMTDGDRIVGSLQLSIIPGLSRGGALRGQIESVRIASDARGGGAGAGLIGWAIEEARRQGCSIVQLTSDLQRTDAIRFYERLGFEHTHAGLKLAL